jgi:chemotaxis protein methyltransferase CheR
VEELTDKEFHELVRYMKQQYGINLSEKRTLVMGRLQHYIAQNGFDNFSDYFSHVISDRTGKAGTILVNKLTTNHTYFLREPHHFEYLERVVLPYLVKVEAQGKDLRIWSAGCSSGEEPYTLAMTLDNFLGAEKWRWDTKILATDISTAVLEKAEMGVYPLSHLDALPKSWRLKFFAQLDGERCRVADRIRKEVIFRRFNLMTEAFPFKKKFHVIFCRNVMIYFEPETKRRLVERFYNNMEPGGYLFIGHSESLSRNESKFKFVAPSVYRKE